MPVTPGEVRQFPVSGNWLDVSVALAGRHGAPDSVKHPSTYAPNRPDIRFSRPKLASSSALNCKAFPPARLASTGEATDSRATSVSDAAEPDVRRRAVL